MNTNDPSIARAIGWRREVDLIRESKEVAVFRGPFESKNGVVFASNPRIGVLRAFDEPDGWANSASYALNRLGGHL